MRALTDDERTEAGDFLRLLDDESEVGNFPYPQHDRMDYGAMRVHAYRGDANYALLFEMLVFDHETQRLEPGHGFCNDVFVYSSKGTMTVWNRNAVPETIARDPGGPSVSLTEETNEHIESKAARRALNPEARAILVRGERVPVPQVSSAYRAHGIAPADPIALRDLLRLLVETHRDALFSTDRERAELTPGMRKLITLDAWFHVDFDDYEAPSETEAMRMLAEVLVTGDPARYAPTEKPNTDWRHVIAR